ncbi:hypothetical protein [Arthrobacter sp. SLBN-53]|uniref:hypothetical protein n=1 Tax=Arthrobacter sp. SLBN-53 TaxID=2768412 RepID=UPI00116F62B1|nr:hypothetical protein [Arthrobacter sp. SLBN-53]TQK31613.1 hypothetical protein FBY28_4650 [Arthrobacter sp. SLBN-53]
MPSALPILSRRRLLIGALPAGVALALLGSTAACAPAPPPADLDDLQTGFDRARSDSELAGDAATALTGPSRQSQVAALTSIAAERSAHADALAAEITRLTAGEGPATATSTTPTTATAPDPATAPTVAKVIEELRGSAEQAARAAEGLTGYRAGLFGSISAACTAAYLVALGGGEKP